MSVFIRGFNLPAEPMILILHPDGNISTEDFEIGANAKAIELPPHGRLIDADALTKMCREMQSIDWNKKAFPYSWEHAYEEFENDIDEAPTVIEAENG